MCFTRLTQANRCKEAQNNGKKNFSLVQGLSSVAAACVKAPLIGECYANLECRLVDAAMVTQYKLFVLEVLKAWIDPAKKQPRTLHHQGKGQFMVVGETIRWPSKMK